MSSLPAVAALTLALSSAAAGGTTATASATNSPLPPSASVPTAAFAPDGTLWVAWVDASRVYAGSSRDLGKTFSAPTRVSPDGESTDANGEARPKIAVGPKGDVYVSYTRKGEQPFTGDIRFARRLSDGRFSAPVTVNDDGLATGHRFDTLGVSPRGEVHLAWIDKRDLERSRTEGRAYEGAALYEAVSADGGQTFSPNRKVKDGICECCRLALAWDGETPVLLWRDILEGGIRDHSLARLGGATQPAIQRATDDGWEISGCPHHGPALAIGRGGTWHLAWFTGDGKRGSGAFYRSSTDGGRTFSEPVRLGSAHAGRPAALATDQAVWIGWKESDGDATVVRAMRSAAGGRRWSGIQELARTGGTSDHPLLIAHGGAAYLSWFAANEGYRLIPVH